jgi:hypothetical protein
MRAMFRWRQRERKLDLFFPAKKAQDVRRGEVSREAYYIPWASHVA